MDDKKTSENTKDERKNKTKPIPEYFNQIVNSILTSYAAAPTEMKIYLGRDLLGHVSAIIDGCGKMQTNLTLYKVILDKAKAEYIYSTEEKPYQVVLGECRAHWERVIAAHTNQEYDAAQILLAEMMDQLKQIILRENLISGAPINYTRNPLTRPTLSQDTIGRYRKYQDGDGEE
ncbi:MAG: hypothetical protein O0X93_01725 [Methanocorpusculum sp.]|nr:hypothetical protein [Methanocorpusculum sp.]MDE2524857.1 hypothetical protein [Methanocorpusculum sp.]